MIEAAFITARGGSVGLPGKNIRLLGGLPLIAWTIRAAIVAGISERIVVSTDCPDIAAAAREYGAEVPFMRPQELATSRSSSADVVTHAIGELRLTGCFALLQPTSPFRNASILKAAAKSFEGHATSSLVSVTPAKPPEWLRMVDERGYLTPIPSVTGEVSRRQDAVPAVLPNGAIYFGDAKAFLADGLFLRPGSIAFPMRAIDSLDIDDADDFAIAEGLVAIGLKRPD